jgi:3-phenylpropionate/trans-cinnamate dioxygenase ferredoxin subunit
MSEDRFNWIKIADSEEEINFGANNIAEVTANERQICIARFSGKLFAFSNKCPHASGFLVNGYIDAIGNVVCPVHRYKFCLRNGRNVSGEGYYLKHWALEVRENGVFVAMEKNTFFGLL